MAVNKKHPRVIGATERAIFNAESELGVKFPLSFRSWLLENNGKTVENVTIFPVYDERDPRKTWDSIVRNFKENWRSWLENFGDTYDFGHLLPFGEFGSGDYYCFDFSSVVADSEVPVVIWRHDSGQTKLVAKDFAQFIRRVIEGDLDC